MCSPAKAAKNSDRCRSLSRSESWCEKERALRPQPQALAPEEPAIGETPSGVDIELEMTSNP